MERRNIQRKTHKTQKVINSRFSFFIVLISIVGSLWKSFLFV